MKVADFFEENYYVGLQNQPIDESITSVIDAIHKGVKQIEKAVESGIEEHKASKMVKEFVSRNRVLYVAIRSILAIDKYLSTDDSAKGASLVGSLYNSLVNGSVDEVKEELKSFYNYAKNSNNKLNKTIEYFNKAVEQDLKQKKHGVFGYGLIEEIKNRISDIRNFSMEYIKRYKKDDAPVTESFVSTIDKIMNQGLLEGFDMSLSESEQDEKKCFYSIVEAELTIDGAKHRNIKSIVVARDEKPIDALKQMKKNVRKSISEINKQIKKQKGKVKLKSNLDTLKVYSNIEDIEKKNPENLVGSENVSKGIVLLKGAMEHGKMGKEPDIYPLGYSLLRKASITRYLNKNDGK